MGRGVEGDVGEGVGGENLAENLAEIGFHLNR